MAKIKNFTVGSYMKSEEGKNLAETAADKLKRINAKSQEENYQLRYVPYDKLVRNPENREANKNIEELAESIEACGLLDVLRVRELDDHTYMLIAGERRWRAIGLIRQKNPAKFKTVPVIVENSNNDRLVEALILMDSNEQRVQLEPAEKRQNIAMIERLYNQKKENGEHIEESVTKRIAKALHVTERQVQKLTSINKKLIPSLQELFDEKKLSLDVGSAIAQLDEVFQQELYNIFKSTGSIDKEDIETYKEEDKLLRTENATLKKELDTIRKQYKEALTTVAELQTTTEEEKEQQLQTINELHNELNEKVADLTKDIVPKRKEALSLEAEKMLSLEKAVNRLIKANYYLQKVIDNGATINVVQKVRINDVINKLNQFVDSKQNNNITK